MSRRSRSLGLFTVTVLGVAGMGCLDRPIVSSAPTTKTNFSIASLDRKVEKVDLLFDIDNSASMGDKQFFLEKAVPDLIKRLVDPNCLPNSGAGKPTPSTNGTCEPGWTLEFPPVHDMHIGILSSSLGSRGTTGTGDPCPDAKVIHFLDGKTLTAHNDDHGHLLARTATSDATGLEVEGESTDQGAQAFLDWFPKSDPTNSGASPVVGSPALTPVATPLGDAGALETDFQALVSGVHEYGCGIESQLESWYRFLIQPDPYDAIANKQWVGVDAELLKERHDFLRPDSLVAILVLTDENDSEVDVRSFGGTGESYLDGDSHPFRGTGACDADPGSVDCTSCQVCDPKTGEPSKVCSDKNCLRGPYTSQADWGMNNNLRHVKMKQKYGIDLQYPLQRYVLGLTSTKVPDRTGEYPSGAYIYAGGTQGDVVDLNCTNPLFARTLPDGSHTDAASLCNLEGSGGPRTADLVYFAHIGGVPHELLQTNPCYPTVTPGCDPNSDQKDTLTDLDWTKILGKNPDAYDYSGIDPHMVESYAPRAGVAAGNPLAAGGGPDLVSGRDWTTNTVDSAGNPTHVDLAVDREYACIFPLHEGSRNCGTGTSDPVNNLACDCSSTDIPPDAVPPVCAQGGTTSTGQPTGGYNLQTFAKAYPTVREIQLVKAMGSQGILSSLCPIHTQEAEPGDPVYGYRPAMNAIVNRLKASLAATCVPHPLDVVGGSAPCLVLATLPSGDGTTPAGEMAACSKYPGLAVPGPDTLPDFQRRQHDTWLGQGGAGSGVPDPSRLPTCEVAQIPYVSNESCTTGGGAGWCYVTGTPAGACAQSVQFTANTPPSGSTVTMQCIEDTTGAQ